jgi:hypothetical protein
MPQQLDHPALPMRLKLPTISPRNRLLLLPRKGRVKEKVRTLSIKRSSIPPVRTAERKVIGREILNASSSRAD